MSLLIIDVAQGLALVGVIAVFAAVGLLAVAIARVVARDGYGHRPAPRGTADWSAGGLPSRPYSY